MPIVGRRKLLLPALGIVVGLCIAMTAHLWSQVLESIDALSQANSDNAQWTLSQVEVEFVQFLNTVIVAEQENAGPAGAEALAEVRRRFDIFFSRVTIVTSGRLYQPVAEDPQVRDSLLRVGTFLSDTAPSVDADDGTLRADLSKIRSAAEGLRSDIRAIPVGGIARFAELANAQRMDMTRLLSEVAAVTVVLILALLGLALVLVGLIRTAAQRARDLEVTGERLRTIVGTALDAIIVADTSGRILEYNAAAETTFGWPREFARGRLMTDLMIPRHHRKAHEAGMKRYLETGSAKVIGRGRVQLEALRSDGSVFPVELSISSARGPDGEIFVSFLRDISHRVANELALREARDRALEGERAKAEFLAVMSHEMRTPLNGLLGSMELLAHTELDAAQRRYLGLLRSSGELLLEHVNDVLDISRLDAGAQSFAKVPIDPVAVLNELAEGQGSAAAEGGNLIEVAVSEDAPSAVLGDPRRLRQVLLNLLGNALKFTRNGRITLTFRTPPGDGGEGFVEFRVNDTGIGIAEADHSKIFDDFVTLDATYGRKAGGTGLGLAITKRLVTAMGGEIGVESRPEAGSTFWFRLPMPSTGVRPARVSKVEMPDVAHSDLSHAPTGGKPLHVLVVEDNEVNRVVLRGFLSKLGHTVDEAHDGDEGVRLAEMRRYDLIFMDISMPRLSGVEATRIIRRGAGASGGVPIVAVTAHALPSEMEAFRHAGIDGTLTKPVRLYDLAQAIDSVRMGNKARAEEAGETVAFDETTLGQLRETLPAEVFHKLQERFVAEAEAVIEDLPALLSDAGLVEARERVHKLAGSAATFGAVTLQRALAHAEQRLKEEPEAAHDPAMLASLTSAWHHTRAGLVRKTWLEAGQGPD